MVARDRGAEQRCGVAPRVAAGARRPTGRHGSCGSLLLQRVLRQGLFRGCGQLLVAPTAGLLAMDDYPGTLRRYWMEEEDDDIDF